MTADLQDDSVQSTAASLLNSAETRAGDKLLLNKEQLTPVFIGLKVDLIPKS